MVKFTLDQVRFFLLPVIMPQPDLPRGRVSFRRDAVCAAIPTGDAHDGKGYQILPDHSADPISFSCSAVVL